MSCNIHRYPDGTLAFVGQSVNKQDLLYKRILDRTREMLKTNSIEELIEADPFISKLVADSHIRANTAEELALGYWAKVHQKMINTKHKPLAVELVIRQPNNRVVVDEQGNLPATRIKFNENESPLEAVERVIQDKGYTVRRIEGYVGSHINAGRVYQYEVVIEDEGLPTAEADDFGIQRKRTIAPVSTTAEVPEGMIAIRPGFFISQETQDKIDRLRATSEFVKPGPRDEDGNYAYYVDADGNKYMRQSEYKSEPWPEDRQYRYQASVRIGTDVDNVVRYVLGREDVKYSKEEFPHLTEEAFNSLVGQLIEFRDNYYPDLHFLTDGIRLYSNKVKGLPQGFAGIAGETDIIAVDRKGRFYIIDTKTFRKESTFAMRMQTDHPKQLSLYRIMAKHSADVEVARVGILPIKVEYEDKIKGQEDLQSRGVPYDVSTTAIVGYQNKKLVAPNNELIAKRIQYVNGNENEYVDYDDVIVEQEFGFFDEDFFEGAYANVDLEFELAMAQNDDVEDILFEYMSEGIDPKIKEKFKNARRVFTENMKTLERITTNLRNRQAKTKNKSEYARLAKKIAEYETMKITMEEGALELTEITDPITFKEFATKQLEYLDSQITKALRMYEAHDPEIVNMIPFLSHNLKYWMKVGEVNNITDHPILTAIQLENESLSSQMAAIGVEADRLNRKFRPILENMVRYLMKDTLNKDITKDHLKAVLHATKDVGNWKKYTFDIGAYDDELLSTILMLTKRANTRALESIDEYFTAFDDLVEKAGSALKWDDFVQKYKDGQSTNRLVSRFTPEYMDEKRAARRSFYAFSEDENFSVRSKAYDKYMQWLRDNEMIFDITMLLPTKPGDSYLWSGRHQVSFTQEQADKHRQELIDALGQKDFDAYMARLEENVERFKMMYEHKKDELSKLAPAEAQRQLEVWDRENSPYWLVWSLKDKKNNLTNPETGVKLRNKSHDMLVTIPRKVTKDGKDTGFYDTRYDKIQNNPALEELHDYMLAVTSTLYEMLPQKSKFITRHGLPFLKDEWYKEVLSTQGGILGLPKELMDIWTEYTTDADYGDVDYQYRDASGKLVKKPVLHINTGKKKIQSLINDKLVKWKLENDREFSAMNKPDRIKKENELRQQFYKEAVVQVAEEASDDIGRTLKAYIMSVVMYHHKSNIQDILNLMVDEADAREKYVTNNKGEIMRDAEGEAITEGKAMNKVEVLAHTIDSFYGASFRSRQGVSDKKTYTFKEKIRLKELQKMYEENEAKKDNLSEEDYLKNKATLEKEMESLGGNRALSRIGDAGLKLVQLKGLGWNALAGVNNLAFGYLSNSIEASRNRLFNEKDLARARWALRHSMLKSATFNKVEKGEAKKMRRIMERLDVLKDASTELFKAGRNTKSSRFRWLGAYAITKRTEYLNQAQTAMAYLLNERNMITDLEGNKVSLYDAFDENGRFLHEKFDTKVYNTDFVADLKSKMDQVIKMVHGNYDEMSPLLAKRSFEGRALLQFKTWFLEAWRSRFSTEHKDHILDIKIKGRYNTYYDLFVKDSNRVQHLGTLIKNMLRKYLNVTSFGLIKGEFTEMPEISDVDRQNLQANIKELIVWTNIAILGLMLKYAFEDTDDEEKLIANLLVNQLSRLQSDIELYSSPIQHQKLLKNAIPLTSLIDDVVGISDSVIKTMQGDHELKAGRYKGVNRIGKEVGEALPITFGAMRIYSTLKDENTQTLVDEIIGE